MSFLPPISYTKEQRREMLRKKAAQRSVTLQTPKPIIVQTYVTVVESQSAKRVEARHLKPGQAVPCDGRIYWDEAGQGWFGIRHPLKLRAHYRRLLAMIAKLEKRDAK